MTLFKKNKLILRNLFAIYFMLCCMTCSKDIKLIQEEYQSGKVEYLKGNLEKSKTHFLAVKKREPDFEDLGLYLGKIDYYQGKFESASREFEALSQSEKNGYQAKILKLKSDFVYRKDRIQILREVKEILNRDSQNIDLLLLAGNLCEELDKIPESIFYFQQVVLESDKVALAHKKLKAIYLKSGMEEKAGEQNQFLDIWEIKSKKENRILKNSKRKVR